MSVKTGQIVTVLFSTSVFATGAASDADATPTGTLYLNGIANAASVAVTNLATGFYKAVVTMPTLAAGVAVALRITATVSGVPGAEVVWYDVGETATASDVKTVADGIAAKTTNLPTSPAAVGSAMTLTAPYDAAKTAAPIATANATAVRTNLGTELARLDENVSAAKTLTAGERTSIAGAVSSLATTGLAALKALLDAVKLKTDTIAETGAIEWTYTLTTPDGAPIPNAEVWVTTDEAGNNVVASGHTNAFGVVTFYLDPGGYFIWAQKSGTNFDNPDFETVTA